MRLVGSEEAEAEVGERNCVCVCHACVHGKGNGLLRIKNILSNRTSFAFLTLLPFWMRLSTGSSTDCESAMWSSAWSLVRLQGLGDRMMECVSWTEPSWAIHSLFEQPSKNCTHWLVNGHDTGFSFSFLNSVQLNIFTSNLDKYIVDILIKSERHR